MKINELILIIDQLGQRYRAVPEESLLNIGSQNWVKEELEEIATPEEVNHKIAFGKKMKEDRERAGLTQDELSVLVGITQTALSRMEKGHSIPRKKNLEKIKNALNLNVKNN